MNHAPTPSLEEIASCVNGYDPDALPISQAREFIDRLVPRLNAVEWLPLRSALGRVLAHDIVSTLNVPAHDNSAMDGYAFAGAELPAGPTRPCGWSAAGWPATTTRARWGRASACAS